MKFYLAGQWVDRDEKIQVYNPFNQEVVDTVPKATPDDVEAALAAAAKGTAAMAALTAYEKFQILRRAADRLRESADALARILSAEEGKTLAEARLWN
jgi:acyl-CoA reductase-like NAD-dependent aldehyde dehydrogenase